MVIFGGWIIGSRTARELEAAGVMASHRADERALEEVAAINASWSAQGRDRAVRDALEEMKATELRCLHIIAAAVRRRFSDPSAAEVSLGAELATIILEEHARLSYLMRDQRLMLARLEALEAPAGPVLQLFCNMADAARRKLSELEQDARDHERAVGMVAAAGELLPPVADATAIERVRLSAIGLEPG